MAPLDPPSTPPVAKQVPKKIVTLGETRVDPYFWLRNRKDPDTIKYLEAENAYTRSKMQGTDQLQSTLYSEMLGRIQQTDETVPVRRNGYLYYSRTEEGKQYAIWKRRKDTPGATEETLIDGNAMAEGHKYFRIGNFEPSPDNRYLAYSVDFAGDEVYTTKVLDMSTGKTLGDNVPNTYYSLEWANDNATFYYVVLDKAKRPYRVYRHKLGGKRDAIVYTEKDERFNVELTKTSSGRYLLINSNSSLTSEVLYSDADKKDGEWKIILPRVQEVEYDVTHHGDSFYIRTSDHAKTFRVLVAPVANPSQQREVLPYRSQVTVEEIWAFDKHLAVVEREKGLERIRIQSYDSTDSHYVEFPEPAYTANLADNTEFDTPFVRFKYSSLVTPDSVIDYNMETRQRIVRKQKAIPSGYDPAQYVTERIEAKAPDGVVVPISLVYKKGTPRDGSAPLHLYGYGAYGISIDAAFNSDRLSLLNRGVIYAIAHIRGGGDLGKTWHEDGRMLSKKNSFTDFIACAEHLIAQKYTSSSRLSIEGRSAGGLLMGAVTTMRPDLFAVVLAGVPFVDVLNTMLDASLPLTIGEYEEWGNPAEEKYYGYMKSYSPYDNVRPGRYPKMLITAGLNDPRVSYWEPAKLTARLRAVGDSPLLLLKTEMGSGHFGSSGRYEYLKETAFNYAYLLTALGVEPGK